jgi:hypothetical protein
MRFAFIAALVAIVLSLVSSGSAFADPGVTLDHGSGPDSDAFVFTGAGFEPGTVLRGKYTTPSGKEYGFTAGYGEATFVAGSDGTWQLSFSPAKSPYGDGASGDWKFSFCLSNDASVCYTRSFAVLAAARMGGGYSSADGAGGY